MSLPVRRTISIELFKFNSTWTQQDATRFKQQTLKHRPSPSVLDEQIIVGTQSLTTPIERSRGFQAAVVRSHSSQQKEENLEGNNQHKPLLEGLDLQDRLKFDFDIENNDSFDIPKGDDILAHIVCFKFRPEIPSSHIDQFKQSVRHLRHLPCVLQTRLVCHGPPLDPRSAQGYHLCLLSFHPGLHGLEEYQASKEHHDVTSRLMFPYIQELTRYDFII